MRLKAMMILPIDDDHVDGSAAERLRGFEATEARAHDDDPRTLLRHAVSVRPNLIYDEQDDT